MLLLAEEVTVRGIDISTHQDRLVALEDFIVGADADGGQVLLLVVGAGGPDRSADDVVNAADREPVSEQIAEQFDDSAEGAVADEEEAENELAEKGAGDGKVEEDGFGVGLRVKGLVEGLLGLVGLLVDELAADVVLPREFGDGLLLGQSVEGELLSLVWGEGTSGGGQGARVGVGG